MKVSADFKDVFDYGDVFPISKSAPGTSDTRVSTHPKVLA